MIETTASAFQADRDPNESDCRCPMFEIQGRIHETILDARCRCLAGAYWVCRRLHRVSRRMRTRWMSTGRRRCIRVRNAVRSSRPGNSDRSAGGRRGHVCTRDTGAKQFRFRRALRFPGSTAGSLLLVLRSMECRTFDEPDHDCSNRSVNGDRCRLDGTEGAWLSAGTRTSA